MEVNWKREFHLAKEDIDRIIEYVRSQDKPVPPEELAKLLSRYKADKAEAKYGARPYSSKEKYEVGEQIVFVTKDDHVARARVMRVNKNQWCFEAKCRVDLIDVEFDSGWKAVFPDRQDPHGALVSNAPSEYDAAKMNLVSFELSVKEKQEVSNQVEEQLKRSEVLVRVGDGWIAKPPKPARVSISGPRPPERGPPPHFPQECAVSIREEWLDEGVLRVPGRLASHLPASERVNVQFSPDAVESVSYDKATKVLCGLCAFYRTKALAPGDQVHLKLDADNPHTLFISARWRMSLGRLLKLEPEALDWQATTLRDCIIVVLARLDAPAHYREIYAEVATHRQTSLGAIVGTLSRYCPAVFAHASRGEWQLAGQQGGAPGRGPRQAKTERPETRISAEVWRAIALIEERDHVYQLLKRLGTPLSYEAICSRVAAVLRVDAEALRATGFLNATDERLRRLEDGTWALEEWFPPPPPERVIPQTSAEPAAVEKDGGEGRATDGRRRQVRWSLLVLLAVVIVIVTIGLAVLVLLLLGGIGP